MKDVQYEMHDDGKLFVSYKGWEYTFDTLSYKEKWDIPKTGSNGKVLGFMDRFRLRSYLYRNYDKISLSSDLVLIPEKDVRKNFPEIEPDTKNAKELFIQHYRTPLSYISIIGLLFVIFLVIGLFGQSSGSVSLSAAFHSVFLLLLIPILVVILYWIYYLWMKYSFNHNYEFYSGKAFVYDFKYMTDDNYHINGHSVRIWDQKKYVLDAWYLIDEKYRHRNQSVILYLAESKNKTMIIVKGED